MPFLRKKAPSSISSVLLDTFHGQTIGIDTSVLLYKFASSLKENWKEGFLNIIETLRRYDITPIFVMDGKAIPEKSITMERRKERARLSKERSAEIAECYENYKKTTIIEDSLHKYVNEDGRLDVERVEDRLNVKIIH